MNRCIVFLLLFLHVSTCDAIDISYDVCSCDLQSQICDWNCCCDVDCDDKQLKSFSSCEDELPQFDEHLCSWPETHHSKAKSHDVRSNSLFCVHFDNYEGRHILKEEENISLEEEEFFLKYLPKEFDSDYATTIPIDYSLAIPIEYSSNLTGFFGLPYGYFADLCDTQNPVKFFQDATSECGQRVSNLSSDCVGFVGLRSSTYHNIRFLNYTEAISVLLCKNTVYNCEPDEVLDPVFQNNSCLNVVSQVHYIITYSTSTTIENVTIKFILEDLSFEKTILQITQKFSVKFVLSTDDHPSLELSGNPGYVFSKPILAGWLQNDHIEYNTSSSFQLPVLGTKTSCLKGNQYTIKFGENLITTCYIFVNLSDGCKSVFMETIVMLSNNLPSHFGAFGNSETQILGDWVPALKRNIPRLDWCSKYVPELRIEIAFVRIGIDINRQAKIIGVLYDYEKPTEISQCLRFYPDVEISPVSLTISVTFKDVTKKSENVFLPFSSVDVRIPFDFFYPFLSSSSSNFKLQRVKLIHFIIFIYIFFLLSN